ncbi:hypothetical protein ACFY2W_20855 [Streptomyces sp. NPDC001262]|uniref:hypothetical protein n=1 Tax=Streptomyces sp. NPDC001262 TaxID=3364552 RepID=UPI0036C1E479
MRLNTIPSAAAAAVCGSLALLIAGPALASDGPPAAPEPTAVAPAPPDAAGPLDTVGSLGETLMLGSRIGTGARAKTPDAAELQELQRRLRAASGRLQRSVKTTDRAAEVPAQLKKLDDDATALRKAVGAEDAAGVTAGVAAVLADQRALLVSVPKVLPGA